MQAQDPVLTLIWQARIRLVFEYAFFGTMATGLELVEAPWTRTLATDGKRLYWNREFVKTLTYQQLKFGLAHEVLHVALDHLGRRAGRIPKIWNMAIDYVTNATLKHERCGEMPAGILYEAKYTHLMSAEEVYDDLMRNSTTIKIKAPYDDHLELPGDDAGDDADDDQDSGEMEVTVLGKNGPPKISRDEMEDIRNQVLADTIRAIQATGGRGGNVPEGIRRKVNELVEPKIDWRSMLDAHQRSAIRGDFTYRRISRRTYSLAGRFILPAQDFLEEVELGCALDTSASMTDEMLRDFLSEIYGIAKTFGAFRLHLWCFDTEVYNYEVFTVENIEELKTYALERVRGNGGTSYPVNYRFIRNQSLELKRLTIFSDGEPNGEGWGDGSNLVDTLFILHGTKVKAPFGQTVPYEVRKRTH